MFSKKVLTAEEGKQYINTELDDDKAFLNYWNLKQVFMVEGDIEVTQNLEQIISKIKASDIIPKVEEIRATELIGNERAIKVLSSKSPDPEIREKLDEMHEILLKNNKDFNEHIRILVPPIRFSIMALLSARKASIFSD